jgi:hypothetical protein
MFRTTSNHTHFQLIRANWKPLGQCGSTLASGDASAIVRASTGSGSGNHPATTATAGDHAGVCGNTGTREQLPVPVVHESAQCRHASRSRIPKALTGCRTQIAADAIQRMFGPISTTLQRKCAPQARSKSLPQQTADLEKQLESRFSPTGQQVRKECFGNAQRARYLPLVTMLNTAKGS